MQEMKRLNSSLHRSNLIIDIEVASVEALDLIASCSNLSSLKLNIYSPVNVTYQRKVGSDTQEMHLQYPLAYLELILSSTYFSWEPSAILSLFGTTLRYLKLDCERGTLVLFPPSEVPMLILQN